MKPKCLNPFPAYLKITVIFSLAYSILRRCRTYWSTVMLSFLKSSIYSHIGWARWKLNLLSFRVQFEYSAKFLICREWSGSFFPCMEFCIHTIQDFVWLSVPFFAYKRRKWLLSQYECGLSTKIMLFSCGLVSRWKCVHGWEPDLLPLLCSSYGSFTTQR